MGIILSLTCIGCMNVLAQCDLDGFLINNRIGEFCCVCGLPLGYYSDVRRTCGRKSLFLARQRVILKVRMLSSNRRSRLEVVWADSALRGLLMDYVIGSYTQAIRLRSRCTRWALTLSHYSRLRFRVTLGSRWTDLPGKARALVAAFEGFDV